MNASEITFGIEIETMIPADAGIRVGPHGHGYLIPQLAGWKADGDPSIRPEVGFIACEFVSPVLKGADGLRKLIADVRAIKAMGAKVNASCGIHIHVGFNKSDAAASARLATLVANFEKAIFASTGTKNRERGRWCNGLQRYQNAGAALQQSRSFRYHVANFSTVNPTVEFRAFAGSLNVEKIVGHIRLCVGLVERAMNAKRVTNWTAKQPTETSPIHRGGEGQTHLTRLFYQLGWTKGRTKATFGAIEADGAPSLKNSKRALMKMARKYDTQP